MQVKSICIVLLVFFTRVLSVSNISAQDLTVIDIAKNQVTAKGIVALKGVIVLDANKDCFFGEITCVISTNSGYYILDDRQANVVYKFDRKGKFCLKFGNPGKGPGEYIRPVWIAVDEGSNQLVIYDTSVHKLLVYNARTASFIREIKLEFNGRSFEILKGKEGFVFYTCFGFGGYPVKSQLIDNGMYYQVIITDTDGKIKALHLPYPDTFNPQNFIGITEVFSAYADVTSLYSQFNDTLYAVSQDRKLETRFFIDYGNGNQQLSAKFINNIGPLPTDFKRNDQLRAASGIWQLSEQLQTNNHIHLTGIKDKSLFRFLVDKKSLNVVDLVKNNQTFKFGFRASDEKYYYSVAFYEAFEKPGSALYKNYPEELKNALRKAEITSNPIVLVWEIASF